MKSAKWDVTTKCNLRCKHCSVADMYFGGGTPAAQATLDEKLLLVDRLADGGVTQLSLLGGEPLTLGEDLFALLRRARERRVAVSLVTNGLLLNPDVSRRLIDHGLANLVVSIESPRADIHNQIRGKRTFERTMPNIETFLRLRDGARGPRVTINTVLNRPNRPTFADMIPFCRDLGADQWNALTLNYIGSAGENLDRLALSQKEHTDVAMEIGVRLKSGELATGDLKINFTIVCPLVWEYLSSKYGVSLPQPEICCSASTSLVYLSPAGELYLCDRVHSSGYEDAPLETTSMRPASLLSQTFEDIWNSRQFVEMYDFVNRAETYAKFEPCNRCKYLHDRSCNPCPLQSFRDDEIRYEECLKAEAYLGDISIRADKPRTSWEELHQFEAAPRPLVELSWLERVRNVYPIKKDGVRRSPQPNDETLLMHPQSAEVIRINAMATQIWDSITGSVTTQKVLGQAIDTYQCVGQTLKRDVSGSRSEAFGFDMVLPFIRLLEEKGFIGFEGRARTVYCWTENRARRPQ